MKLNRTSWLTRHEGETMARSGEARLVKQLDGKIELIGGSFEDRAVLKEWIAKFLPDVVVSEVKCLPDGSRPVREQGNPSPDP